MSDLKPPPTHPGRRTPHLSSSPRRLPPAPDTSTPPPSLEPPSRNLAPAFDPSLSPLSLTDETTTQSGRPVSPSPPTAPPAPDSYLRDPHKLVAYIVPFPQPTLPDNVPAPPLRFLIYTPPPPPLLKPKPKHDGAEGGKEGVADKVQRKWQEEVRAAHESNHKVTSWGGIKARVTRGVNWAMGHVTTADLDFLTRVPQDGEVHRGVHSRSASTTPASATPASTTPASTAGTAGTGGAATPTGTINAAAPEAVSDHPQEAADAVTSARDQPLTAPIADGATSSGADVLPPAYSEEAPPPPEKRQFPPHELAPKLPPRRPVNAAAQETPDNPTPPSLPVTPAHDDVTADPTTDADTSPTQATVKLEEMVLIYPPSMNMTPEELKVEFVNNLLRTKSKAQRDAVIATGLLPITAALDWALMFVGWVFGGALEVDAVWAAASIRGAKTARSVTKRLSSTSASGDASSAQESLKLSFTPSHRADLLTAYLHDQCVAADHSCFEPIRGGRLPSAHEVLESIGWEASGAYERHNWEDERWERDQVERDLQTTMGKAAKAWRKWCEKYAKNPERAVKK